MPVTRNQSNRGATSTSESTMRQAVPTTSMAPPLQDTTGDMIQQTSSPESNTPVLPVASPPSNNPVTCMEKPSNMEASSAPPQNTAAQHSHLTPRPRSKVSSRKAERHRRLARLEIQEKLAELEMQEIQAATRLQRAKLEKIMVEIECTSSSDDEMEEDCAMTAQKVDMWLEKQPPLPAPAAADYVRGRSPLPQPRPAARPEDMEERGQGARSNKQHEQRATRKGSPARSHCCHIDLADLAAAITDARQVNNERQPQPQLQPKYLVELPLYTGKADEWLSFKATFTQTKDNFTSSENITRLRRSLKGLALEAVSSLLIVQTDPERIIQALERRFGRPEAIVSAEMDKIKTLPRISDSPRELAVFANKVANIVAAVQALGKTQYLNSHQTLRLVVDKLSPITRNKWYDYASQFKDDVEPKLIKLTEFLNEEADKCADYIQTEREQERPMKKRTERAYLVDHACKSKRSGECPVCNNEHQLPECPQFRNSDVTKRWEVVKAFKICFRCLRSTHRRLTCRARVCGENGCSLRHHKLLHLLKKTDNNESNHQEQPQPTKPPVQEEVLSTTFEQATKDTPRRAYLKVALVTLSGPKGSRDAYALFDEGSTVSIIDTELAEALGLDGPNESMTVQGVNGNEITHDYSKRVSAKIKGRYENEEYELHDARTVNNVNFFTQTVRAGDIKGCKHIEDIMDRLIYESATPTILIGQDNWELIVSREVRNGPRHQPVASRTLLGWVLHGCRTSRVIPVVFCAHISGAVRAHDNLEEMMKKHFALESLGIEARKQGSDPQQQALNILDKKSQRLPDGRYETGLLWRDENAKIPDNYENTMKRLRSLEKKLDRDEDLKQKYKERIDNLLRSNYAERATAPPTGGRIWYLPHFAVVNPEKEKIRLVHDAAAKSHGLSLNDMLLPGPDLLQSLPGVIMKFRQYPIAVSSDIKEMFMQVKIREEDRDAQRFLWRGDRRGDQPPDEYRMTSLIFGATSSPCTALYIKNRNARENEEYHPAAAQAIQHNHYMDDYLQSFTTIEEAIDITQAVDYIHRKVGFELRGWASNDANAIRQFTRATEKIEGEREAENTTVEIGGNEIEKTLGLLWHVKEDTLGFRVNKRRVPQEVLNGLREPTKREALSLIMSIFDPLGIISPITTPAKRIMQDTWKYKTGWDDVIPDALKPRWKAWLESLERLPALRVPRCYDVEPAMEREMHTFVDASEEAYAAVVYLRAKRADGSIKISIAAAKSRVTPTKPISIPRLELQAAVVGVRLAKTVEEGHDFAIARRTYWSDSRTALAWIRSEPRTYKAFVAHRLAEIEDLTKKDEWRWVPTSMNTADDSTRNTPKNLTPTHRWFNGPDFLYQDEDSWPTETKHAKPITDEEKEVLPPEEEPQQCNVLHGTNPDHVIDFARFSKWSRLVRTIGRALQFIDLCRRPQLIAATRRKRTMKNAAKDETYRGYNKRPNEKLSDTPRSRTASKIRVLEAKYLYRSERLLIRLAQKQSYGDQSEAKHNRLTSIVPKKDELASLSVMTDNEGIMRLRGRINEADTIDYETANPVILDGKHRYTKLYIQHVHEKLHHGGVETVVNELRQRLWIVRIRPTVKEVIKRCLLCRLRKAKPASPSTGNLPAARLAHHARPFTFTGVDYFGPIEVTVARHREKRYVALFTCMTSRAVHLEVVQSLSTDSAINALRRFIARRGCPTELWSDNATCFRSANRELTDAWRAMEEEASNHRITWRFLPPAAPFMAGVWERMVRTVKDALRITLHEQRPSDETLATLLAEVEATVNSRPLTHVAITPDAPPSITPNMILLGPNSHVPTPGTFEETDVNARAHWRRAQRLADIFWRRWVREYMPLLQNRREPHANGTAPKVGDMVIICDPNLPRNIWPRGRVTTIYPGKDNEVRVVDVITSSGNVLRRPTKRIVVLPVDSQDATAGECARPSNAL